jgi:peptidyl-prolyl cis-trans isomerase D
MLEQIRSHTRGWFAWAIIITIAIVFALWGVYGYMGVTGAESQMAVTVDGRDISRAAVDRLALQMQQNAGAEGDNVPIETLRQQAENQLIMQTLLLEDANRRGFSASKELVDRMMLLQPEFQQDGQFSPALFEQIAASIGYTPLQLRQLFGDEIVVEQIRGGIIDSTFISDVEVKRFLALQEQTRDVQYITFPLSQFVPTRSISDDEIKQYYEKHIINWQTPEEVSIAYIRLTAADVAKQVSVTETEIETYYNENKAAYTAPEQREVAHILLALPVNPTKGDIEKISAQAEEIKLEILNKKDFAGLARQYSADRATAGEGGNLGWVTKGVLAPEFDEAVFNAAPGTVLGPIRTEFGIHIAEVLAVKPAAELNLAEVHDAIAAQLTQQKVAQRFVTLQEELASLSYETPDSLEEASAQLNLPVQTTGLFSAAGGADEMTSIPAVLDAAFSSDVLAGDNSHVISLGDEDVMVLRVHEHKPAATQPLADVRVQVLDALQADEAQQQLRKNVDDWLAQLKEGKMTRAEVAQQVHGEWKAVAKVKRGADEQTIPATIRDYAFNLPRPIDATKPSVGWVALSTQEYALVAVTDVQEGKVPANTSQEWQQAQNILTVLQQQADYGFYVEQLRDNADIKKH